MPLKLLSFPKTLNSDTLNLSFFRLVSLYDDHIQKVETRRSGWSLAEVGRSAKAEGKKVSLILHFTFSKYFVSPFCTNLYQFFEGVPAQ